MWVSPGAPVPIQLQQHTEADGELRAEKDERLARRDVPSREGARTRACCEGVSRAGASAQNHAPTALSRFRSHMSLIVQPAPRMTSAPRPKSAVAASGAVYGSCSAWAAMVIDHAAGVRVSGARGGRAGRTAGVEEEEGADGLVDAREEQVRPHGRGEAVDPCWCGRGGGGERATGKARVAQRQTRGERDPAQGEVGAHKSVHGNRPAQPTITLGPTLLAAIASGVAAACTDYYSPVYRRYEIVSPIQHKKRPAPEADSTVACFFRSSVSGPATCTRSTMSILRKARVFVWGEVPATKQERNLLLKIDWFILSYCCLMVGAGAAPRLELILTPHPVFHQLYAHPEVAWSLLMSL